MNRIKKSRFKIKLPLNNQQIKECLFLIVKNKIIYTLYKSNLKQKVRFRSFKTCTTLLNFLLRFFALQVSQKPSLFSLSLEKVSYTTKATTFY